MPSIVNQNSTTTETQNDTAPTSEWTVNKPSNLVLPPAPEDTQQLKEATEIYKVKYDVFTKPTLKIVEVPLFSMTTEIVDSLPIFPEVNFIPLIGNTKQAKILLNAGTGNYEMDPIVVEDEDVEIFKKVRTSRNLGQKDPLPFRSEDPPAAFQIFRTTEHPSSYRDFAGKMYKSIETYSKESKGFLTSATELETLEPNTKYCYMFRSVDVHGNISNPSPIYKIELVNDSGANYLLVENVELLKKDRSEHTKQMKKVFNIVPRMVQSAIDSESIVDYTTTQGMSNVKLGLEQETLWGKKFKIRFVSKQTGKKIDLNVNFKTGKIPVK